MIVYSKIISIIPIDHKLGVKFSYSLEGYDLFYYSESPYDFVCQENAYFLKWNGKLHSLSPLKSTMFIKILLLFLSLLMISFYFLNNFFLIFCCSGVHFLAILFFFGYSLYTLNQSIIKFCFFSKLKKNSLVREGKVVEVFNGLDFEDKELVYATLELMNYGSERLDRILLEIGFVSNLKANLGKTFLLYYDENFVRFGRLVNIKNEHFQIFLGGFLMFLVTLGVLWNCLC